MKTEQRSKSKDYLKKNYNFMSLHHVNSGERDIPKPKLNFTIGGYENITRLGQEEVRNSVSRDGSCILYLT